MASKLLQLVPALLAAGCFSSGDPALDSAMQSQDAMREMLVYDRGIVCVTAPCPYYQVVDRMGNAVDVASIEFDPQATRPRDPDFGALVVKGWVETGNWYPGEAGNVLHVTNALGPPPRYLTYALRRGQGAYGFIADDHIKGVARAVDLTPLGLNPVEARFVLTDLQSARVISRGWMTIEGLMITDLVDTPEIYTVADNGIRCVVEPCPSISVYAADGTELFQAASIDLDVMQLAPRAEAVAAQAFMDGAPLYGWFLDGSWQPHDTGAVVYVTRPYQPEVAPVVDWGPLTFEIAPPASGPILR